MAIWERKNEDIIPIMLLPTALKTAPECAIRYPLAPVKTILQQVFPKNLKITTAQNSVQQETYENKTWFEQQVEQEKSDGLEL